MIRQETAEEVCDLFIPRVAAALMRENRTYLRYSRNLFDLHVTVGSRLQSDAERAICHLSPELQAVRPAYRVIYDALAELRGERGLEARIMPADIIKRLKEYNERAGSTDEPSRDTVNHGLADLEERELIHSSKAAGWLLGPSQLRIEFGDGVPVSGGHSAKACSISENAHASRVARESVSGRITTRGPSMAGKREIWVPGERWEGAEGGLVLTDTKDKTHFVEGPIQRLTYEGRMRTVRVDAVRCELVSVDDSGRTKAAFVRVVTPEGRRTITVRALGDWQLEGRLSDREEASELTAVN